MNFPSVRPSFTLHSTPHTRLSPLSLTQRYSPPPPSPFRPQKTVSLCPPPPPPPHLAPPYRQVSGWPWRNLHSYTRLQQVHALRSLITRCLDPLQATRALIRHPAMAAVEQAPSQQREKTRRALRIDTAELRCVLKDQPQSHLMVGWPRGPSQPRQGHTRNANKRAVHLMPNPPPRCLCRRSGAAKSLGGIKTDVITRLPPPPPRPPPPPHTHRPCCRRHVGPGPLPVRLSRS